MKAVFQFALFLSLTLTTFNASAANVGEIIKRTELKLENVEKGSIIVLKDKFDTVLYKETVEMNGEYQKNFDFSLLPEGYYFFEVTKGKETKRYPVKVTEAFAKVNTKREIKSYAPVVTLRDNLLYVSQQSTGLTKLRVSIFAKDSEGEFQLVKKDFVKDENFTGRIYKLKKKKATDYKVVIKTKNGDLFEEFVTL